MPSNTQYPRDARAPSQAKRDRIAAELLKSPRLSNRALAATIGVDDKTVAAVRRDLESTAAISPIDHRVGLDGRKRDTRSRTSAIEDRATVSGPEPPLFGQTPRRYFTAPSRIPVTGDSSVLEQVRSAFSHSPLAFLIGLVFGGFVPVATWDLMHLETVTVWRTVMIGGGALFSSVTVFEWANQIFRSKVRAVSFALLVESTMLLAETRLISMAALVLLVLINSASSAVHLLRVDRLHPATHGKT